MSALLFEAKVNDGVTTIEFREWRYRGTYELNKEYRDTTHNGSLGGFSIELDTSPLNFSVQALINDANYAALKLMENSSVTLSVKDNSGVYTVIIKNVIPGGMLEVSQSVAANFITATTTFRRVTLNLIRET